MLQMLIKRDGREYLINGQDVNGNYLSKHATIAYLFSDHYCRK
jgi:hypothetical protein